MDSSLQDLQQIFEYELKRKLSERARKASGEMSILLNGFKFFDINYTGIITKAQWIKGILRTGLTGFPENDLDSLFILYDKNNTGQIDYKNFCSFLYGREPLNPLTNNSQNIKAEQNDNKTSENNLQNINNANITNMNSNNQLNEFNNNENSYNNNRQFIQKRNYNEENNSNYKNNTIKNKNFNNNNQYNINNNERRQMNSQNNYFNNNQNDNFGYNIQTPINNYEYQENGNFRRSQRKINSFSTTFNNIFQQETNQINNKKSNKYNLSESAINSIITSIRNNININNGIKLFTFIKNLKTRELNNSYISINDLYNIFQDMRINIPYDELKILFNYANKNDSDIISTEQLINIIKGNLEEQRRLYIVQIFSKIDKEQTKKVSIELLKNMFNAKKHPEVINGTKSEEEAFEQFCLSLDLFCELIGIPKNGEISFENFIEYYSYISASIPDEVYFEDMLNGVWSDNNINNAKKMNTNNNSNIISTNDNCYNEENNKYNMNSILMGISTNERNNNKNLGGNNYKYNNKYNNNMNNQIEYNNEKKIKNSMSSPFFYENNDKSNDSYNIISNQRNSNNNIINNNAQSPYMNYSYKKNSYNKFKISVPKGIENFQNKNKRRYNPILDEYYPEIQNENKINDINNNNNLNANNIQEKNYQLNQIQNNNMNIINNNINNNLRNTNELIETNEISNSNNKINPIIALRNIITSRGPKAIFTFQRMLTIFDRNNSCSISLNDFINIFQVYNLNLSDPEIQNIFSIYNQNNSSAINYSFLIDDLVGEMSEQRIMTVQKVFNNFTKNEKDEVSLKEIKQKFNPRNHPDVLNRKKESNEVYGEFLDMLEIYREYIYNLKGGFITSINFEDFKKFYAQISLCIKDDNDFESMMSNCWNLNNNNTNNGYNRNNEGNYNDNEYGRNIRARTGQQIMNMNNRGF